MPTGLAAVAVVVSAPVSTEPALSPLTRLHAVGTEGQGVEQAGVGPVGYVPQPDGVGGGGGGQGVAVRADGDLEDVPGRSGEGQAE